MTECSSFPHHIEEPPAQGVLVIPYQKLSADALDGVLEEYVSREGTDYGDYNVSFTQKKQQVLAQLASGKAVLLFNPEEGRCHIELATMLAAYHISH